MIAVKWLILGVLLGLLFAFPQALDLAVAALASKPMLVAFLLGAVVRPYLPLVGRWTR